MHQQSTKRVIWEETGLIEPEKNCSNNNDNVPSDIINVIKNVSTSNQCNDIGKIERRRASGRAWYQRNKESRKKYCQQHYQQNKDYYSKKGKRWRSENKTYFQKWKKNYRTNNKTKIREYHRVYCDNRLKQDIDFKLSCGLRTRLNSAIRGNQKGGSAVKDLGCNINAFKLFIENKWSDGMTWENYGINGWHLDHIIPLSSFDLTDRDQFLKACHYTNYQPLWAMDNIRKGNKLI